VCMLYDRVTALIHAGTQHDAYLSAPTAADVILNYGYGQVNAPSALYLPPKAISEWRHCVCPCSQSDTCMYNPNVRTHSLPHSQPCHHP
jgi:hypothetical protein